VQLFLSLNPHVLNFSLNTMPYGMSAVWQRSCFTWGVSTKKNNSREETKMKKTLMTITIAAITILTWASVLLADGGGGGL
jgi:hypothetical protein